MYLLQSDMTMLMLLPTLLVATGMFFLETEKLYVYMHTRAVKYGQVCLMGA